LEPSDAEERTRQQGKNPFKEKKKMPGSDMKITISEIQKQKAIKMVEDILMNKKNSDNSDVTKKVNADSIEELPLLIRRNLKSLLNTVEKHGFSKEDIIKLIKKGE
jgi:hypothetical protein